MDVAAFENVAAFEGGVAVVVEESLRTVVASEIEPDALEPGEPSDGELAVAVGGVVAYAADVEMFGGELAAAVASVDVESAAFAAYAEAVAATVAEPAVEFAAAVVGRFVEIEDSVGSAVVADVVVFEVVGDVAADLVVEDVAVVRAVDDESGFVVVQAVDVESDPAAVQAVDVFEAVAVDVAVVRSELGPVA